MSTNYTYLKDNVKYHDKVKSEIVIFVRTEDAGWVFFQKVAKMRCRINLPLHGDIVWQQSETYYLTMEGYTFRKLAGDVK